MADKILELAKHPDPSLELKYNKFYIGIAKEGLPTNLFILRPKKGFLRFEPRLENTVETTELLENSGLDVMDYSNRSGRYRIRLKPGEIEKHKEILTKIIKEAYGAVQPD